MSITPTIQNTQPTINGSEDTWGSVLNDRLEEVYDDITNIASQFNVTQVLAADALSRAGGTLTGNVVVGDPTPAGPDSIGLRGLPTASTASDYSFVAKDAGKCLRLTGSTTRTWTIPPSLIAVGQVIVVRNASTATLNLVRGSGVQLRIAGSGTDSDKAIVSYGFVTLYQEDTNVWMVSGTGVS